MACPIGAIELTQSNPDAETIFSKDANPNLKTSYRASKCDLCYDQPDGPACVKHCPEKALVKMSAEGSAKSRRTEAVLAQIAALGGINAVNLSESEEDVVSWTTGLPSMLTQLNGVNVSEEDVARWRSFAVENDTLPERALDRGFWTDSVQPARKAKNDDTQR
jgi:electron transport protein HydN